MLLLQFQQDGEDLIRSNSKIIRKNKEARQDSDPAHPNFWSTCLQKKEEIENFQKSNFCLKIIGVSTKQLASSLNHLAK